jgi:hypothetical protein
LGSLLIFVFVFSPKAFAGDKIFKSVYAIYDKDKRTVSTVIDNYIKEKKYSEIQNYEELGCFYFLIGENKKNKQDDFLINTKQIKNDMFMFVKVKENKKSIKDKDNFLSYLKDHKVNTIEIESKRLSQNLEDDAVYTLENNQNKWKDDIFDPNGYKISVERYVGYKKINRKNHRLLYNLTKKVGQILIYPGKALCKKLEII